jgi:hypothetical protein
LLSRDQIEYEENERGKTCIRILWNYAISHDSQIDSISPKHHLGYFYDTDIGRLKFNYLRKRIGAEICQPFLKPAIATSDY